MPSKLIKELYEGAMSQYLAPHLETLTAVQEETKGHALAIEALQSALEDLASASRSLQESYITIFDYSKSRTIMLPNIPEGDVEINQNEMSLNLSHPRMRCHLKVTIESDSASGLSLHEQLCKVANCILSRKSIKFPCPLSDVLPNTQIIAQLKAQYKSDLFEN